LPDRKKPISKKLSERRDRVMNMPESAGLNPMPERCVLTSCATSGSGDTRNDIEFAKFMVKDAGVATVPQQFFSDPAAGKTSSDSHFVRGRNAARR
jgi:aspartate/methionine/tyrosine aminotransferase